MTTVTDGLKDDENAQREAAKEMQTLNPCFVMAHELYDALPIH